MPPGSNPTPAGMVTLRPNAVKAFDEVLERWPANNKTPEAMLKKGQALVLMDKRTDGATEFRQILTKFPRSDIAPKACSELKALGYNCSLGAATKKKRLVATIVMAISFSRSGRSAIS